MKIIKFNELTLYFLFVLFLCGYLKTGLIIIFIIIIHELGHVFFLKLFKKKIIKIIIYPFGGITYCQKDLNTSCNVEILISLGGILFQLFIYVFLFCYNISFLTKEIIFKYNTFIILFNLLPIIPLDGFILLNSILNKYFCFKSSYKISGVISIIFLILLVVLSIIFKINIIYILFFLIYKIINYFKEEKYIYNKFLLERYIKNYKYKYINTSNKDLNYLKIDNYHYYKKNNKIESEKEKLHRLFDN